MGININVDIGFDIIFNTTGFEWVDLQYAVKEVIENKYRCLSQITDKYYDKYECGMTVVGITKGSEQTFIEVYMKLNGSKLDVIFLQSFRDLEYYTENDKDIRYITIK